ncbi:retrovirus-related Pol polyprotein from transposon 412 [Trichonephila clavipes]|nr:retrovirus-related Pol polyprotein from transposon 412 [Trichonephila clavipes]
MELHGSPSGGHFGVMKNLQKVRERSTGTMCGVTWTSVVAHVIPVLHAKVHFRDRQMATTISWLPWIASLSDLKPILFPTKRPQLLQRSAVHETTSYSPSQMLFGRDLRLPADLLFSRPPDAPLTHEEYIEKLQARMEEMHHLARKRIGMASEKMKTTDTTQEQLDTTFTKATKCGYGIRNVAKDFLRR